MSKTVVDTKNAPKAIGPYSQAVIAGNFVFVSGQLPIEPESGEMCFPDIELQTAQVLKNIRSILEASGSSIQKVVKVNVYLKDLNDFQSMNKIYESFFGDSKPARATVEVSAVPKGSLIEIDCIAIC